MSRAGSGTHTHTHTHTHLHRRALACLRHTSVHAFILAGTTHLQICTSAHACLHAHKIRGVHTRFCIHTWLGRMLARILSTAGRLCKLLHSGACPDRGWGKEWRNQAHAFPFELPPPPNSPFFYTSLYRQGFHGGLGRGEHGGPLSAAVLRSPGTCTTSTPSFPGLAPPSPSARAPQGRTVHSCGWARAACSFLPVLPPPRSEGRSALPP